MWVRVELPEIAGPLSGFTFPRDDVLYVLTPGGLVRVALAPAVDVRPVADTAALTEAYGPRGLAWDGQVHLVYDADGGDITPCDHPNGDRIVPACDGTLLITDPSEREVQQRIASIRLPAGNSWLFAGFSHDYRWLVAGEPGGLQVFRYVGAESVGAPGTGRDIG
ncbi:MAG TPA: hypothetical protein VKD71_09640 [Gemmataceae bacterium]|nr:hypothetical protein [Gemmataceae bacterium]